MPTIELPEFGSAQTNENEPTIALKQSGWADGDEPPASVLNWIARSTYDSVRALTSAMQCTGAQFFANLSLALLADDLGSTVAIDPDNDTILIAGNDGGLSTVIRRSTDFRTFTNMHEESSPGAQGALLAIVPSTYAILFSVDGGALSHWYYAAYPYSTWTQVVMDFNGPVVATIVADIGDGHGPSLLALTDEGRIWVADATSAPTMTSDWTEYDISSVVANATGIATDGTRILVSGDDGAGNSVVAHALAADGVTAADFTVVPSGFQGTTVYDIVWNGDNFVAVEEFASAKIALRSADGVTWTILGGRTFAESATSCGLVADDDTGFVLFFARIGTEDTNLWVFRDAETPPVKMADATAIYAQSGGYRPAIHKGTRKIIAIQETVGGTERRDLIASL